MPQFSIVIPMYNRERLVGRAIESCLKQTYTDFEVIVVDDGSTDRSVATVEAYTDPRIRLVRCDRNRGVSPARNAGVDAARGEWIVFLDSDDELLPAALAVMDCRAGNLPPDIDRMVFMFRLDTGGCSPNPPLREEVWDFGGYLRWMDALRGPTDFNNCIRRRTFAELRFQEDRALERSYHFEFASRFQTHAFPDYVGIVHSDAENRSVPLSLDNLLATAANNVQASDQLLARHGAYMAQHCPGTHGKVVKITAILHFLCGNRIQGWKCACTRLRTNPFSCGAWLLLMLGMLDAKTIGRLMMWKRLRSERRQTTPGQKYAPA